jgi:hypothetical protein
MDKIDSLCIVCLRHFLFSESRLTPKMLQLTRNYLPTPNYMLKHD